MGRPSKKIKGGIKNLAARQADVNCQLKICKIGNNDFLFSFGA